MEWLVALLIGVLGNLLTLGLIWFAAKVPSSLSRRDPRRPSHWLLRLIIFLPLLNFGLYSYVTITDQSRLWLLPIPISLTILVLFLWKQLDQFWRLGLRGADQQITKGINYHDALKLIHNELKFLGIGASKLSREEEFAHALGRCRQDQPVQLLLCSPNDRRLVSAARKFGKPENEYRDTVTNSLRRIADLRNKRDLNIEVRFYPEDCEPVLRLMFIDNSICLFSYNVWGEGDGSHYPQLHIVNLPPPKRVVQSYYYPLEVYFENLWQRASSWNFKDYLSGE